MIPAVTHRVTHRLYLMEICVKTIYYEALRGDSKSLCDVTNYFKMTFWCPEEDSKELQAVGLEASCVNYV